jgi:3-oxoacyl-[acyl-carrier protein] reductase
MKLSGKVAIVTGASRGIGRGMAFRYAQEGASVVLASRSLDLLSAHAEQIRKEGGKALALEVDVSHYESVEAMVSRSVKHFGRVDIMVNNAGISMAHPSEDLSPNAAGALSTSLRSMAS